MSLEYTFTPNYFYSLASNMIVQLFFLVFVLSLLYTLRRIWRLSAEQCIVTHYPKNGGRVLTDGIWVLYPLVESVCSISWTVSKYDAATDSWLYQQKKKQIIDLKSRSFTLCDVSFCTKDAESVLLTISFTYQVSTLRVQELVHYHRDPILETKALFEQTLGSLIYSKTLGELRQNRSLLAEACLRKLRLKLERADIPLHLSNICLSSIRHKFTSCDNIEQNLQVLQCCKHINSLKKKFTALSDVALSNVVLHFIDTKSKRYEVCYDSDSSSSDSDGEEENE